MTAGVKFSAARLEAAVGVAALLDVVVAVTVGDWHRARARAIQADRRLHTAARYAADYVAALEREQWSDETEVTAPAFEPIGGAS